VVERTVKDLGGLDILVNNAGIAPMAPIDRFALEDFDRTFAINLRSVFVATQAAIQHMPEGGRIINIGSCNAERMPFAGGAVYAMSKSALQGLVKGLARDLGSRGITINNVQPGPVDTDLKSRGRAVRREPEGPDGPAALQHSRRDRRDGCVSREPRGRLRHRRQPDDRRGLHRVIARWRPERRQEFVRGLATAGS
jgi:NAD(P)-dependent dehydrogenase (short-subunit alcohol dehydrogenase family)